MPALKNHPTSWLNPSAAAAFDKLEAEHGVFTVNSAGRTVAQQQSLINAWDTGGTRNRPPYLYPPARPAATSNHVKNGGQAVDIGDWKRFAKIAAYYGFVQTHPSTDPVHFEYRGGLNKILDRQRALNRHGFGLVEDGIDGPATRAAVLAFQRRVGLRPDGIYGPNTQDAAEHAPADSQSPLAEVQSALKKQYPLYASKLVADGIDGPATRAAVKEFQRRAGLTVDGIAGPATRAKLGLK